MYVQSLPKVSVSWCSKRYEYCFTEAHNGMRFLTFLWIKQFANGKGDWPGPFNVDDLRDLKGDHAFIICYRFAHDQGLSAHTHGRKHKEEQKTRINEGFHSGRVRFLYRLKKR